MVNKSEKLMGQLALKFFPDSQALTCPGTEGVLYCVLCQDTLLSQCLPATKSATVNENFNTEG